MFLVLLVFENNSFDNNFQILKNLKTKSLSNETLFFFCQNFKNAF